eukprot:a842189_308.p1 GENE.a842189_308~~a842189_308.p1  ORF type:complete len:158 (-),score=25.78 a842189_308:23-469(-)
MAARRAGGAALKAILKMRVPAREAAPGAQIGATLGQAGIQAAEFCKQFNAATAHVRKGVPMPLRLSVFDDRTFKIGLGTPPASYLLKMAAGVEKGAAKTGSEVVGEVSLKQIYEIAKIKNVGKRSSLESMCRSIVGSARSMGIRVVRK